MFDRVKSGPPRLHQNDPRNRLSRRAQVRVAEAFDQAYAMQLSAKARFQARGGKAKGAAYADLWEALAEAAYTAVSVEAREFMAFGLRGSELREIVDDCVDAAAYSLELPILHRDALRARVWLLRSRKRVARIDRPIADSGGRPTGEFPKSEIVRNLRQETGLNQESLAASCGVNVKTIQRAETGCRLSESSFAAIAAGFAKELKRRISAASLKNRD